MSEVRGLRDTFRDPRGWLIDALPWPLRRVYIAAKLKAWPPDTARLIGFRRPPRSIIEALRRLEGLNNE